MIPEKAIVHGLLENLTPASAYTVYEAICRHAGEINRDIQIENRGLILLAMRGNKSYANSSTRSGDVPGTGCDTHCIEYRLPDWDDRPLA